MSENGTVHPTYTYEFIKGDFDEAVLTGDAHSDNLMTARLGLGAEFCTMRGRMNLVDKMLSEKHVLGLAAFGKGDRRRGASCSAPRRYFPALRRVDSRI